MAVLWCGSVLRCRVTPRLGCFTGSRPSTLTIATVHLTTEKTLARLEDIPQPTRELIVALECSSLATRPFVAGPPLPKRRVAIISSAALFARSSTPFMRGATDFRELPASLPSGDILMSHVSISHDRTGWQRDINVVYPIDRLKELAAEGTIGSVATANYSVLGSTDPALMDETADAISTCLLRDGVDAVLLCPV
jgi:D-proline reductase (dithiol) PrdB